MMSAMNSNAMPTSGGVTLSLRTRALASSSAARVERNVAHLAASVRALIGDGADGGGGRRIHRGVGRLSGPCPAQSVAAPSCGGGDAGYWDLVRETHWRRTAAQDSDADGVSTGDGAAVLYWEVAYHLTFFGQTNTEK